LQQGVLTLEHRGLHIVITGNQTALDNDAIAFQPREHQVEDRTLAMDALLASGFSLRSVFGVWHDELTPTLSK
jgi:hypothetical protein